MTFLEKYDLLKKSIPVPAVMARDNFACEYVDIVDISKNSYYCFDSYRLFDSIYTNRSMGTKLVDCTSVFESEKCFQCIECTKLYSCTYLIECNNCTDCHFSAFLNACTDCFGCVGLTHKKYCIFNKQYTKEEYLRRIEELKKEKPEKIFAQLLELKQKIPHPASQQFNSENCQYGNHIYDSKKCYWCFQVYYAENSGYSYGAGMMKNCWDMYFAGGDTESKKISERCYEHVYTDCCYNSAFLSYSFSCTNCNYSAYLRNCSDCFGCVGLTNKKYCILNNQLTKEQYEKAVKEIKKELGWKV